MKTRDTITVFEHDTLKVGQGITIEQLRALHSYYGEKGVPFFSLIHNGVKFNEHVGVIQVGNTLIEVLPKTDKESSKGEWREMLIKMLRASGTFDVHTPSTSALRVRSNSILELYFELFLNEVQRLMHQGLTKKYRKSEANVNYLKGSLKFAKHFQHNLVHKEHFYVRFTTYDVHHKLHQILYKTINLIKQINTNPILISKVSTLSVWFPEMDEIGVTEDTFNKIVLDRKTEGYRKALEIAKLLLLNFHPDVSKGKNNVLALMFNMNLLWERFVLSSLRKELPRSNPDWKIKSQTSKFFWKPSDGNRNSIRPDIVINSGSRTVVLDTKWKNLKFLKPSDDDLKQMFVYHEYFHASKVALVYPGSFENVKGNYFRIGDEERDRECSLIGLSVNSSIKHWQFEIGNAIRIWINT